MKKARSAYHRRVAVMIQGVVQKIAEGRILATLKKRNEKRRRGRLGKLLSCFGEKSGKLDIQKALLGLLSRIAVQRGQLIIAKRWIPVKAEWETNKICPPCQGRFYAQI